ncbi:MAG: hypothetical protein ABJ327_10115 [Litoreibacter sp.]
MRCSLNPLKTFIIAVVLFSGGTAHVTAQSTIDQTEFPTPDVIACFKAVEPLSAHYRAEMQVSCLGSAGDMCVVIDEGKRGCMYDLVTSMREFYGKVAPLLPNQIEGNDLRARRYELALPRLAETFANVPDCIDFSGYELSTCELIILGSATADLLERARLAEVELP